MDRDIRSTALFQALEADARRALQPGSGLIAEAFDVRAAPDAKRLCFSARVADKLVGTPALRLCIADVDSAEVRFAAAGSIGGNQHGGRWSPDGGAIAFLSDRERAGCAQLHLLALEDGLVRPGPAVADGFVESLQWHADGRRLLLGVAGLGADLAGANGGINAGLADAGSAPDWAPEIHTGAADGEWRRAWIADLATGRATPVSPAGLNVWESVWCGEHALVACASDAPEEGAWYAARVVRIDAEDGSVRALYTPKQHLGGLSASPSGRQAAVIEAVCSDRTIVAGEVMLIDTASGHTRRLDAGGVDVTHLVWQGETRLLFAGHRGLATVLGAFDLFAGTSTVWWSAEDRTFGNARYPEFDALDGERVAAIIEGFDAAPTLSILARHAADRPLRSFGSRETADEVRALLASATPARWTAPDGLEIEGWLLRPQGGEASPQPTVLEVHGGPVWMHRPRWLGSSLARRALLRAGYVQLLPNPRGSGGRGQDFAGRVCGDMGGTDTQDYLSGIAALVSRGVSDPRRLCVWGGSYGGFMTSWLVTQDRRFAAAVAVSPVTNWTSQQLTCQIPEFCELFLADTLAHAGGRHATRSPVMFAAQVSTPVLNICGALDRNTPPGQAQEFHAALRAHGVTSALLTYPQEGHGVRAFPAAIDFTARLVGWFDHHSKT